MIFKSYYNQRNIYYKYNTIMKTLIFSIFIVLLLTCCGAKKKANCDAYSQNGLNHIVVDTLTKQAEFWTVLKK